MVAKVDSGWRWVPGRADGRCWVAVSHGELRSVAVIGAGLVVLGDGPQWLLVACHRWNMVAVPGSDCFWVQVVAGSLGW